MGLQSASQSLHCAHSSFVLHEGVCVTNMEEAGNSSQDAMNTRTELDVDEELLGAWRLLTGDGRNVFASRAREKEESNADLGSCCKRVDTALSSGLPDQMRDHGNWDWLDRWRIGFCAASKLLTEAQILFAEGSGDPTLEKVCPTARRLLS
jgi:hypothetical protein